MFLSRNSEAAVEQRGRGIYVDDLSLGAGSFVSRCGGPRLTFSSLPDLLCCTLFLHVKMYLPGIVTGATEEGERVRGVPPHFKIWESFFLLLFFFRVPLITPSGCNSIHGQMTCLVAGLIGS